MSEALRLLERARSPASYRPSLRSDLKDALKLAQLPFAPKREIAPFVIFGQGRSGSTLLVTLLDSHPSINCHNELLSMRRLRPMDLLRCYAQRSSPSARAFGFHLKPWHISRVQGRREVDFVRDLDRQGYQFIHLSRQNAFLHCLSQAKLHMHRIVHSRADIQSTPRLYVDPDLVLQLLREKQELKELEALCLSQLSRPYASVVYENDLAGANQQGATCNRLFAFLGQAPFAASSPLRKVSPSNWRTGMENADEIEKIAVNGGFGEFVADADRTV